MIENEKIALQNDVQNIKLKSKKIYIKCILNK